MASFQKTLNLDAVTIRSIYARGSDNSNIPAFRVLATDGLGGTAWTTISTLQSGGAFHKIVTNTGTYVADLSAATFNLLDGPNAGLLSDPTASNTAYLYAKAFGTIDISGGNSVSAYRDGVLNTNVKLVGGGGINIRGDPQENTIVFDGRELPFISTMPYSFNQLIVYSNVPSETSVASTFSSIILQANGPSSILRFVGLDPVLLITDYATNEIKFSISSLNAERISSIFGQQIFLLSTSVTKQNLSTLSTTYGQLIAFDILENNLSSISSSVYGDINLFSTNIGDVASYPIGISTVWYASERDNFVLSLVTNNNMASTNATVGSNITNIYNIIQTEYNVLKGSTIQTPYFWASTLVTQIGFTYLSTTTPSTNFSSIGLTYYPTYSSFYNPFGNSEPFGNPTPVPIYTTNIITDSNNAISTVSTLTGIVFSTNYALQGKFIFYPEANSRSFEIKYSGALFINVFGQDYGTPLPQYPRISAFTNNTTVSDTISGFTPVTVEFTFLKRNPTDYVSFSNMMDVLDGTTSYQVAPLFPAYGYNTSDVPLYTTSIPAAFPLGFSTLSNLVDSPYQQLSSYVVIASTFYTTGCNTTFPISTSGGFTSFSFYEVSTGNTRVGYSTDLSDGISSSVTGLYSSSNAFGYSFLQAIPSTPYVFEVVYGRQQDDEIFTIAPPLTTAIAYDYAYAVYVSSMIYASTVSSYTGEFVYLNVGLLNLDKLYVSSILFSTLSSCVANIYNANITTLNANYISANYANITDLYVSTLNVFNVCNVSSLNASTLEADILSSFTASILSLNVSSINGEGPRAGGSAASTISTFITNMQILNSSFSLAMSSFSSPFSSFIYTEISSLSTAIGHIITYDEVASTISTYSTSVGHIITYDEVASTISTYSTSVGHIITYDEVASTISTYSTSVGHIITYDEVASTISTYSTSVGYIIQYSDVTSTISTFSTAMGQVGSGGGSGNADSTISTFITYINELASTISGDASTLSTVSSFPITYQEVTSTISTFSTAMGQVGSGGGGTGNADSTISSFVSYINELASTISGDASTLSTTSSFSGEAVSTVSSFISYINLTTSTIEGDIANYVANDYIPELHTSTLFTSSMTMSGVRQPFIQYGRVTLDGGNYTVYLSTAYTNEYSIQLTAGYTPATPASIPYVSSMNSNAFTIFGDDISHFWTTFGDIF
jgi:hypothetical protein